MSYRSILGKALLLSGLLAALLTSAQAVEATLVADAHVNSARPTVNSGTLSNINVGAGYTGLLQFDLGVLPPGSSSAQIARATLRLYTNRVDTSGLVSLQLLKGAWSEYGVTSQTLPATGSANQVFTVNQAGQYVSIDVTTLVQGWIDAPATNFGLALSAGTASVQFDSKENDLTGHQAQLDIQTVALGPAGAAGAPGAAGVAGPAGLPGPAGTTGPAGPAGAPGPQGVKGLPGMGFEGTYSSATNYGLNDIVVFQGSSYISTLASNHGNTPGFVVGAWTLFASMGASGSAGPAGIQGTAGAAGIQGPAGTPGANGAPGVAGTPGTPGLVYQGTYQSIHNYVLGDVVLWQGASWASLASGNHGNTPDQSPAYWGILTLQGPQGAVGAPGSPGPQGIPGALGPVGPPGERGDQGLQGIAGQAGAQGIPGAPGTPGLSGPMGPQGPSGPVGLAFHGPYQSSANYALADGVQYNGAGYVSLISGNHGNTPDQSPAAWALFAAAGTAGAPGTPGTQGVVGPTGPPGLQGSPGPTGSVGPQGPQGPAVVNYQGNYSSASNYRVADAVSFGGSTYVSLATGNHGNTPDQSPASWAVLVAQGPAGTPGTAGPQGSPGAAGSTGAQGPAGAQGPPVTFRGGWSIGTPYAIGDTVGYAGGSFIALLANSGRQPDISPVYWAVLAQSGAAGVAGPQGAPGTQGPTGYPGAQGPAGPPGPTGGTGPTGAIGPIGPAGAAGVAGQAGPQGLPGASGTTGAQGPAGPQGPPIAFRNGWLTGSTYAVGDTVSYSGSSYIAVLANSGREPDISPVYWSLLAQSGSIGPAGPQGSTGFQGPTGYPGPQGPAGPAGPTGGAGPTGANGPLGPVGPAGVAGPAGPQGVAGPTGGPGIQGPAGPQGPPITFRNGWATGTSYAVGDTVTLGGSSYIALLANSAHQPDASPTYWAVLAQSGAPGPAGSQGATGFQGPTGYPGPQGPAGTAGPTGASGPPGQTGPAGSTGPAGAAGPTGPVGLVYQGTYSASTNYPLNAAVTFQGSTFLSLRAGNAGNTPPNSPSAWSLLASAGAPGTAGAPGATGPAGVAGPTGPAGGPASVQVGSVTTGAAGSGASVVNVGTASAAVLNFTIPQGAAGTSGSGSGSAGQSSGVPLASMFHSVSYMASFYSVNNSNQSATELASVLTWVPSGCTATQLTVFSQQASTISVTLRTGTPGSMTNSALSCSVAQNQTCTATGSVTVPVGGFLDLNIAQANSNPSGVWTLVSCN